ncbi:MAG: hypothetical protein CM1200mP6_00250 [Anaerolineaceae bacterium]|nr:MAG: hypothetical protein CM1200mP6_00250 [Anaerolineaceae bacterium]
MCGASDEQKGHKRLLRAFRSVVDQLPEASLLLLGDGPLRKDLEDTVIKLDISKNVCLQVGVRMLWIFCLAQICLSSFRMGGIWFWTIRSYVSFSIYCCN